MAISQACQEPEKASDGMGGTYFMANEAGVKVAIFKPCDEEPLAPNNPKGYVGRNLGDPGWKSTVRVGEVCRRNWGRQHHCHTTSIFACLVGGAPMHLPVNALGVEVEICPPALLCQLWCMFCCQT